MVSRTKCQHLGLTLSLIRNQTEDQLVARNKIVSTLNL